MYSEDRRMKIIQILNKTDKALSASYLGEILGVSRQIIVGDIALLRAQNNEIISTNRGYILKKDENKKYKEIFWVKHDGKRTKEELNIIVDAGAKILDVIVEHNIYGCIKADLNLSSRREVENFVEKLNKNDNRSLSSLTNMEHYHTVEADSKEILEFIEGELKKNSFLVNS
ncbi:transcription repressor NadR [Peptostreptococcus equinus]|uniref:Transcription repressor NadR n=1 Tax=Peptostreptococcus equinus TaxID=3003601 RepID=A0ABY7JM79_9FIRM|nr:transcription repressor NadR [Peptostreptococcus sp. CBA3647]WAW14269.1 transcription repressor NadR [Peptostreptococcus sp. CBA3647]